MKKKQKVVARIRVEEKAHEILAGLGLRSATKCYNLIHLMICDLCYDDLMARKESLYVHYSNRLGSSVATVERLTSYGNERVFVKKTKLYQEIFGWYGDGGIKAKRNYDFLNGISAYIRRYFLMEWDEWTQRDILIHERIVSAGLEPTGRGFSLLKEGIHRIMDAYGDLLPMKEIFPEGNLLTNLTACSRALLNLGVKPKQFMYDVSRELLMKYPTLAGLTPKKSKVTSKA